MSSREENYRDCHLVGGKEKSSRDGEGYWVEVYSTDRGPELKVLFREITRISRTAAVIKYQRTQDAIADMKNLTFAKARARIDLELFDEGQEYIQEVYSTNVFLKLKPVDDDYIQRSLLQGLLNIRKKYPDEYDDQRIDVNGFCQILAIDPKQFLFNASLLLEDSHVDEGPTLGHTMKTGGIFITSNGVRFLKRLNEESARKGQRRGQPKKTEGEFRSDAPEVQYDVVISFAGEDREIAERLAEELRNHEVSVFYDAFEKETLWGKNLYEYLDYIYKESARYCVMILSKSYADKSWTNHERRSAQARAFREQREYILPIRLDDTEIPGLPETVGYISLKKSTIEEIIQLILKKLKDVS